MKRILLSGLLLMAGAMVFTVDADARNHRGANSERQSSSHSVSGSRPGRGGDRKDSGIRPGNSGSHNHNSGNVRPGGGQNMRPGANKPSHGGNGVNNGNSGHRPGSGNMRPGAENHRPGNGGLRPGANGSGGNHNGVRPGAGGNNGTRPGMSHGHRPPTRPGAGMAPMPNRPVHRPVPNRPHHMNPPMRPGRPMHRPWVRPVPPRNWRPVYRTPLLSGFLGLSFGIALDLSLNSLRNGGYVVDGYNTDQVYLRNVREQGFYWPDATLYYGNGGLQRSQFYYSTLGNYTSAYNQVYSRLVNSYGAPVETLRNGVSVSARWFGYNGDYITLEYTPMNAGDGLRYFTILTYGN